MKTKKTFMYLSFVLFIVLFINGCNQTGKSYYIINGQSSSEGITEYIENASLKLLLNEAKSSKENIVNSEYLLQSSFLSGEQLISNGVFKIIIDLDDMSYTVQTDVNHTKGPNNDIFYGSGNPWSTYDTILINSTSYCSQCRFGLENYTIFVNKTNNSLSVLFYLPEKIIINRSWEIFGTTNNDTYISMRTVIENNNTVPLNVSLRYMWDLKIADNDGSFFKKWYNFNNDSDWYEIEKEWLKPVGFMSWEFTDDKINPTFSDLGSINVPNSPYPASHPDKFSFTQWSDVFHNTFEHDYIENSSISDSAVAFYYYIGEIYPGNITSRTVYVSTIKPAILTSPDLAIINIFPTNPLLLGGNHTNLNVTIINMGDSPADIYNISLLIFNSSEIFYNSTIIGNLINYQENKIFNFEWNYSNVSSGNYTIQSEIQILIDTNLSNNIGFANITILSDTKNPSYYNETIYNESLILQPFQLNITWVDDVMIDFVILEFNGINHTVDKSGEDIYPYSISSLDLDKTYYYKWYAKDTSGNWNQTNYYNLTIIKVNTLPNYTHIPDQEWLINTNNTNAFDLDDYFYDLDLDNLTYVINTTNSPNITIILGPDNRISFYPLYNWSGVQNITIISSDSNGSTISNTILLTVYYCGDMNCNHNETCSTCSSDCGSCSVGGIIGGRGGGGSGGDSCRSDWECSAWTKCFNNKQTRVCNDTNRCRNPTNIPITNQDCCSERWVCNNWHPKVCPESGRQTRVCTEINNCGTELLKPSSTQNCDYIIQPNCYDKIKNQGEKDIDCGGPCSACIIEENPALIQQCCLFRICWFKFIICWYWWLLILFLIICFIVHQQIKEKKKYLELQKQKIILTQPPEARLQNYIEKTLAMGYSKDRIRTVLLRGGWKQDMVDNAFTQNFKNKKIK
jgi:hypothetical protein